MRAARLLLLATVVALFLVILVGAYVTAADYGDACGSSVPSDWPGCLGGVLPPLQIAPVMEYSHRLLAALSTLFIFVTTAAYWRSKSDRGAVKKLLLTGSVLIVAQVFLGGVVIAQAEQQAASVAAHQGLAVATFGLAVAAFALSSRGNEGF